MNSLLQERGLFRGSESWTTLGAPGIYSMVTTNVDRYLVCGLPAHAGSYCLDGL
jgi:hypothetical protein